MATIIERKRKDGTSAYLVQITVRRGGKNHREAKTFRTMREARSWAKFREEELEDPAALVKTEDPQLREAIKRYVREARRLGRTKSQVLRSLQELPIADMRCSEIRSHHIVDMARSLAETRHPSTVASYMSYLGAVFEIARPGWNWPLDNQAMQDALVVAAKQGLTGRSDQRDRRPTLAELDKLMGLFIGRREDRAPMAAITAFAIFSARRESEICRLLWDDLDGDRILVRDAKDPRGSAGNHIWTELTPEAQRIIKAQPKDGECIFPYKPDTIATAWRDACKLLDIKDLKFHDLRHEAVSRLFEMGRTIPQVASVSGHRSWQNLQRYTHLRQTGDKYEGWRWLDRICQ